MNKLESTRGKFQIHRVISESNLEGVGGERLDTKDSETKMHSSTLVDKMKTEVDHNGFTVFHRAAIDYQFRLFEEAKDILGEAPDEYELNSWSNNGKKSQGVTPLTIACYSRNQENLADRQDFILYLLEQVEADVNVCNEITLFTPLHWLAHYGDTQIIQKILKPPYNACAFVPDAEGFYPLDYAGRFDHADSAAVLIRHSIEKFKELVKIERDKPGIEKVISLKKIPIDPNLFAHEEEFLSSSLYASRLLFWACNNPKIEDSEVEYILNNMEAYPEGNIQLWYNTTTFHQVAINGDLEKMRCVCEDYKKRHTEHTVGSALKDKMKTMFHTSPQKRNSKTSKGPDAKDIVKRKPIKLVQQNEDYQKVLTLSKLKKLKKADQSYEKDLILKISRPIDFDMRDDLRNTPLHYAAAHKHTKIVDMLLREYKLNYYKTNAEGRPCAEMGSWYDSIRQANIKFKNEIIQSFCDSSNRFLSDISDAEELFDSRRVRKQLSLLTDKNQKVNVKKFDTECLRNLQEVPFVPFVALKCQIEDNSCSAKLCCGKNKKTGLKKQLNLLLRQLQSSGFTIRVFKGVEPNIYFVTIAMSIEEIKLEARSSKYPVSLIRLPVLVPFSEETQEDCLPFNSRDITTLIISRFDRMFDIESFKKRKLLLQIFPLHESNDLNNIFKENKFGGHSWSQISSLIFEDVNTQKFKGLVAFKNYFGEKKTLIYAFFKFNVYYLTIPSLIAIGLSIYQFSKVELIPKKAGDKCDTLTDISGCKFKIHSSRWVVLYAIFMLIYSTVLIERWKRKYMQILYEFGIMDFKEGAQRLQLNPHFIGQVQLSTTSLQTDVKDKNQWIRFFYRFLNMLVGLAMISCTMTFYFMIKDNFRGFMQGFLLSLLTTFNGTVFKRLCEFFVEKANFKYLQERNSYFMVSMVLYRFIDINLPIFYNILGHVEGQAAQAAQGAGTTSSTAATSTTTVPADKDEQHTDLYWLILSLTLTKSVSMVTGRYMYRYTQYLIRRNKYWSTVAKKAKVQQATYRRTNVLLDEKDRNQLIQRREYPIYKNCLEEVNDKPDVIEPKSCSSCCAKKKPAQPVKVQPVSTKSKKSGGCCAKKTSQSVEMSPLTSNDNLSKNSKNTVMPFSDISIVNQDNEAAQQPIEQSANTKPALSYQRTVLSTWKKEKGEVFDEQPIATDFIEINALMPCVSELYTISDYTEKFNILALGILYVGITPLTTTVVWIYFMCDLVLARWMECNFVQRQRPEFEQLMTSWNMFIEVIIVISLFFSCLLLYRYSDAFTDTVEHTFKIPSEFKMAAVVVLEHILLAIVVCTKFFITDIPLKLYKKLMMQKEIMKLIFGSRKSNGSGSNEDDLRRIAELEAKLADQKQNEKDRVLEIIRYHEKSKEEVQFYEGHLSDFLPVDRRQHKIVELREQLDKSLSISLENRLYRESFLMIERAIMQRKFSKIMTCNRILLISCVECNRKQATVYCYACEDHFCQSCFDVIHKATKAYEKHKPQPLELNPASMIPLPSATTSSSIKQQVTSMGRWRKFEYFNFPLDQNSDYKPNLQKHFNNLKRAYINLNYIDEFTGKIDVASVLVDQNYDGIEKAIGKQMQKSHESLFGKKSNLVQKESIDMNTEFNDEELYYLNRVAFRLFKKYGVNLSFPDYVRDLQILQDGRFEDRLSLWLQLVNEIQVSDQSTSNSHIDSLSAVITRQDLSNVIRASYPQDIQLKITFENVVMELFGNGEKDYLTVDKLNAALQKGQAADLMKCILQYPIS